LLLSYGLTESGSIGSMTRASDIEISEKFAYESIGQCLPFVELKIVDPKTNQIVVRNVDGEICLRGFNIMKGYLDDPKKTAEAIDANGYK
jgi:fatty-acyl-CoA synthase